MTDNETRILFPSTASVLAKYAKSHQIDYRVEEVRSGDGAMLHWMGDRKAKKVILYFHGMTCPLENGPCSSFNRVRETKAASAVGGGYGLPASEGHPAFLMQCLERLAETGKIVVAAFLEYGMYKIF